MKQRLVKSFFLKNIFECEVEKYAGESVIKSVEINDEIINMAA